MMMGFDLILLVLVGVCAVYLLGWRPDNLNIGSPRDWRDNGKPLEVLRERYASGEISKEEYEAIRHDLAS